MATAAKQEALVKQRPAETSTVVAAAVVTLIAAVAGITDPQVLAALTVIVGAVPAAVTWYVSLRG